MDGNQGRAGCGLKGNIIDYIQKRRECSFEEACEEVEIDPQAIRMYRLDRKVRNLESEGVTLENACMQARTTVLIIEDYRKNNVVPDIGPRGYYIREKSLAEKSEVWRTQALSLARWASSQLTGEALEYLYSRGLANRTIKAHLLGFYPTYKRVRAEMWGYEYTEDDQRHNRPRKREIWIPRGIVIPWFDDNSHVVCLRFRRLPDDESEEARLFYGVDERTGKINRYKAMYGSSTQYLYCGELLTSGCSAALFEGEIDALIASQEVDSSSACTCVATGSTGWGRSDRFIRRLASCDQVLVCFDVDENRAGEKASLYWRNTLNNARRWRPLWSDASDMASDGISLKGWLAIGLEQEDNRNESETLLDDGIARACSVCGCALYRYNDEGIAFCAEHFPQLPPAPGPDAPTPTDEECDPMDNKVVQTAEALFPGTVRLKSPDYTIQDATREMQEHHAEEYDYWRVIHSNVERPPVDDKNKPFYTRSAWRAKLADLQNWRPDARLYAHYPGGYEGYAAMYRRGLEDDTQNDQGLAS